MKGVGGYSGWRWIFILVPSPIPPPTALPQTPTNRKGA